MDREALGGSSVDFKLSESMAHTRSVCPSWILWDFNFQLKIISLGQKIYLWVWFVALSINEEIEIIQISETDLSSPQAFAYHHRQESHSLVPPSHIIYLPSTAFLI